MTCTDWGSDLTGGQTYSMPGGEFPNSAFDNNTGTAGYWSPPVSYPVYMQVQFGSAVTIGRIRWRIQTASYGPHAFKLLASNTGAFSGEETELLDVSGLTWSTNEWKEWIFDNANSYIYYRVKVSSGGATYLEIVEMEMYECQDEVTIEDSVFNLGSEFDAQAPYGSIDAQIDIQSQFDAFNIIGKLESELIVDSEFEASSEKDTPIQSSLILDSQIAALFESQEIFSNVFDIADEFEAFNWSRWLALNKDRAVERYYFTLTGAADNVEDVEIPISSLQARKRTGESTYLSVVIPYLASFAELIAERSSGAMIVELAYNIDGQESIREQIIAVDLEDISIAEGAENRSIVLSGHRTQNFPAQITTLYNPIYKQTENGRRIFRFARCDLYLNPGDTAIIGDDSFTVDYVTYTVSDGYKSMEIREIG